MFSFHIQYNFHILRIFDILEIIGILENSDILDFYMNFYTFFLPGLPYPGNFPEYGNILIMSYFRTLLKFQYESLIGRRKQIYRQVYNIYAYALH